MLHRPIHHRDDREYSVSQVFGVAIRVDCERRDNLYFPPSITRADRGLAWNDPSRSLPSSPIVVHWPVPTVQIPSSMLAKRRSALTYGAALYGKPRGSESFSST